MSDYKWLQSHMEEQSKYEPVIQRFRMWLLQNAGYLLIEKHTMNFEPRNEEEETLLKAYVE